MIEKSEKPQEPQESSVMETKARLLAEMESFSVDVLTLAYMYARGYALGGEDVTKAWTNAVRNNHIVEQVYRRGYEDCEKDYAEKKRRDFVHKVLVDLKE